MAERQSMTAKEVVAELMSDEHADDLASRCAGWTTYADVRISRQPTARVLQALPSPSEP